MESRERSAPGYASMELPDTFKAKVRKKSVEVDSLDVKEATGSTFLPRSAFPAAKSQRKVVGLPYNDESESKSLYRVLAPRESSEVEQQPTGAHSATLQQLRDRSADLAVVSDGRRIPLPEESCMVITGQTRAGKTAFLNKMLRDNMVDSSHPEGEPSVNLRCEKREDEADEHDIQYLDMFDPPDQPGSSNRSSSGSSDNKAVTTELNEFLDNVRSLSMWRSVLNNVSTVGPEPT